MNDHNENRSNVPENTGIPADVTETASAAGISDDSTAAAAADDEELFLMPDYEAADDSSAYDDEREILERINSRKSEKSEYVYPDLTFPQKISEFWYHHKGTIILFVIIALCAGVIAYSSIPARYDVDTNVYVSFADFPTSVVDDIAQEMTVYIPDWDGDGEPIVYYYTINMADSSYVFATTNMIKMSSALQDKPSCMLWILDQCLYDTIIESYGEEMFESFEGAPLWIEITFNDSLNEKVSSGESPRLGFCLRRMTDEFTKDKGLVRSYERAQAFLAELKEDHPEMFVSE